jgi:hypothetical protein
MYVDFDPDTLFGGTVADLVAASSHGSTSKNEKKVAEHLDHIE